MKKKIFFGLILVVIATGGAFAQTWYNSYAPGIGESKVFINAGIGLGPTGGYDMGVPPLSASVDFKLPVKLPITVGGIFTFAQWKYSYSLPTVTTTPSYSITYKDYEFVWNNIGFGARGMYHFNFLKNLDTYAGLTLGYVIQTFDGGDYSGSAYEGVSFFLFGANIGARYFFTQNIGAYFEVGYSGLQFASLGLSIKF
ncbi:MAG: hypothetical protein LBQ88_13295 [Treponema sp.]|jgi:hypothetical protein|nr:hypothetical protein [Treponema sp.]